MPEPLNCYDVPQYWDLAFDDDTVDEANFIEAAVAKYCEFSLNTLYEPGCGGGRLVVELSRRGHSVVGIDLSAASVEYANLQLQALGHAQSVAVGDMRTNRLEQPADAAYCLVNTFRHLLTEDDALQHLKSVAASIREGGLYVLGMHLLPPDADEEDEEEWSVTKNGTRVNMRLDVAACYRSIREETLRFQMEAVSNEATEPVRFTSDYRMRTYEAEHMRQLIQRVPELELVDVYDFWYDIQEPLTLSDEMGDTVFILQKVSRSTH